MLTIKTKVQNNGAIANSETLISGYTLSSLPDSFAKFL